MIRRRPPQPDNSFVRQLWHNMTAIVATAGVVIAVASNYFGMKNAVDTLMQRATTDNVAREELRKALVTNADKTSEAIGKLTTQAAVQAEQTNTISKQLDHVVTQLQGLAAGRSK